MKKLRAIFSLLFSRNYIVILSDDVGVHSYAESQGSLEDVILSARGVYEVYDMFMDAIIEQATESGELATAQAFQKAIKAQEKRRGRH